MKEPWESFGGALEGLIPIPGLPRRFLPAAHREYNPGLPRLLTRHLRVEWGRLLRSSMDADQNDICQYLKSWPGQFVSGKEICRRAGGKWRYREDEKWALPVLQRMIEDRLLEADSTGHFRLIQHHDKKNNQKRWLSPEMKRILEESGKAFEGVDLEEEVGAAELTVSAKEAPFCQPGL